MTFLLQMVNTRSIVKVVLSEQLRYADSLLEKGVADAKLHERLVHLVQHDTRAMETIVSDYSLREGDNTQGPDGPAGADAATATSAGAVVPGGGESGGVELTEGSSRG